MHLIWQQTSTASLPHNQELARSGTDVKSVQVQHGGMLWILPDCLLTHHAGFIIREGYASSCAGHQPFLLAHFSWSRKGSLRTIGKYFHTPHSLGFSVLLAVDWFASSTVECLHMLD
ncbi:hypothetical protein BaRGS_00024779 [Batillaria attramentaria]|uniref:Uncharacterized protein n=1 Tax=Batillaria attramentaria TaxID=370345 RepID=A0ABD0K9U7_9CAEN